MVGADQAGGQAGDEAGARAENGAAGVASPTSGPAGEPPNPLQRVILDRLRERGWSYGVVARRGGLPRSTVYHLAVTQRLVRPPRPDTLDGLARGLELPIAVVRAAAADATGLHYYEGGEAVDQETAVLIASLEELTAEDRRHVAALVESMRRRYRSTEER
ncbi:MAG: transcriptional regulator [Actinomycetes bacterium]